MILSVYTSPYTNPPTLLMPLIHEPIRASKYSPPVLAFEPTKNKNMTMPVIIIITRIIRIIKVLHRTFWNVEFSIVL